MKSTLKRTWAEIDLDALEYNYQTIRSHLKPTTKFLGVVKADAYGHGSVQIAGRLQELGADYLAVSSIDEAIELRTNGITMPILILGHTPKEQVDRLICFNITQAVTCKAKADEYNEEALKYGGVLKVHIKVDTGMSRLGYLCKDEHFQTGVDGIVEACQLPGLETEGIFTHFAMSDEDNEIGKAYTHEQFDLFQKVIAAVEKKWGQAFAIHHCANTGATVDYPQTHLDMVRPGLLLYGYGAYAKKWHLKPLMAMKTTVSTIKVYDPGTHVSYGGIYTTDKQTRMGVVPYGYADGFLRSLSNRCALYTCDGPAKQRGRICMDMAMIDLTDKPHVDVGSEIEIFGPHQSLDDWSELAGTIPYEIVCAISKRVPRLYLQDGKVISKELLLRM